MKSAAGCADGDVILHRAQEQKIFYEEISPFFLADLPSRQWLLNPAHILCHFDFLVLRSPAKKLHVFNQGSCSL